MRRIYQHQYDTLLELKYDLLKLQIFQGLTTAITFISILLGFYLYNEDKKITKELLNKIQNDVTLSTIKAVDDKFSEKTAELSSKIMENTVVNNVVKEQILPSNSILLDPTVQLLVKYVGGILIFVTVIYCGSYVITTMSTNFNESGTGKLLKSFDDTLEIFSVFWNRSINDSLKSNASNTTKTLYEASTKTKSFIENVGGTTNTSSPIETIFDHIGENISPDVVAPTTLDRITESAVESTVLLPEIYDPLLSSIDNPVINKILLECPNAFAI